MGSPFRPASTAIQWLSTFAPAEFLLWSSSPVLLRRNPFQYFPVALNVSSRNWISLKRAAAAINGRSWLTRIVYKRFWLRYQTSLSSVAAADWQQSLRTSQTVVFKVHSRLVPRRTVSTKYRLMGLSLHSSRRPEIVRSNDLMPPLSKQRNTTRFSDQNMRFEPVPEKFNTISAQ